MVWCSGEGTRLPPGRPGFDSWTQCHIWVEFVVGLVPPRYQQQLVVTSPLSIRGTNRKTVKIVFYWDRTLQPNPDLDGFVEVAIGALTNYVGKEDSWHSRKQLAVFFFRGSRRQNPY